MSMTIVECQQGTEEWFRARMGMPTASEFSTVMAKGRNGEKSKTRDAYMRKLAGELITGEPMESYSNAYMERGKAMEADARNFYALMTDTEPEIVGFVHNEGPRGCSPDSFIGAPGMLEIKTAAPHILIEHILANTLPAEHVAQCQGALWVCEREWIDLCIYWPKMPPFIKRAYRDDRYINDQLAPAVRQFNDELAALVEKIKAYR